MYSYFPDIHLVREKNYLQQEYIALVFEMSIKSQTPYGNIKEKNINYILNFLICSKLKSSEK